MILQDLDTKRLELDANVIVWHIMYILSGNLQFQVYCKPKDLHSRTGRDDKKGKTKEKTERGRRKRSSSAGSEKMERVGGR